MIDGAADGKGVEVVNAAAAAAAAANKLGRTAAPPTLPTTTPSKTTRTSAMLRRNASYNGGTMEPSDENHPDFEAIYTPPPSGTQSAAVKRLPAEKSGDPHFAVAARDRLRDKFGQAWRKDGLDAVVCPVFPCPAPRVEEVRELTWAIQSTQIFNFLDYAAGVVPVTKVTAQDCAGDDYDPGTDDAGLSDAMKRTRVGSEGLPVAVQVVAR